ncbi:zinc metalloprotease HtpX [Thermosynechococcus vestitus]|uniref:Tll1085 protein n=1 Tax=Thermosynechococcus vestitus (strain NIES-2133 / IAM M-273 / BP-1) TaxID=197221 RepID=Q8DJY5_THEVB|nr:zinc metalloprotease HtpX [Thermosynechococcus vestitus]BAC08638.1 tll1085 [Thermosynechococcus vestitus BP-1]
MPNPESDFRLDPRYVAGLAAFNRGDYQLAIAAFKAVIASHGQRREGLKAHLHLIKAYAYTHQWQEAIELCQLLARSPVVPIRTWAQKHLPELERYMDEEPTSPHLVFVMARSANPPVELRRVPRIYLWLSQGATLLLIAWLLQGLLQGVIAAILSYGNDQLALLRSWEGVMAWFLVGCLGLGLLSGGSWLWSWRLRTRYGLRPVRLGELEEYSPETVRLLERLPWSGWQPRPQIGCLMTAAPVIFSYGRWQRRIIVSEGLLRSLSGEELLALMATEIAQLRLGLNTLVTPLVLLLQLPYDVYCWCSRWGDRYAPPYRCRWQQGLLRGTVYGLCALLSQGSYLLFRGLELLCFWSNQLRQSYSDRQAAALVGNPNTLVMAWLRLMEVTARTLRAQGEIGAPLESLRLLLPLNPTQAALWGDQPLDWPALIRWDTAHPLRYWFRLTSSHRPLGLRLQALMTYARQWRLEPLLSLPSVSSPRCPRAWQQLAPFWGAIAGLFVALLLTGIGQFALRLGPVALPFWWLADGLTLARGFIAIGIGLGLFLRFNAYYPLRQGQTYTLAQLLHSPSALPLDSTTVELKGRLWAAKGLRNGLGQHLWLETDHGWFPLRCYGSWGPIWPILEPAYLKTLWGRSLLIRGWFRRGTVPFVEVQEWHSPDQGQKRLWAAPYWAIATATLWILYGIMTLLGWI